MFKLIQTGVAQSQVVIDIVFVSFARLVLK